MATVDTLLTLDEYEKLPDTGRPTELVRGRVIEMNVPTPWHGYVCGNVAGVLRAFVKERDLGRVMTNDAGVVTERGPDTVRGPDVSYYSFARLPKGPIPKGYLKAVPELVIEVRSPDQRWSQVNAKVGEYQEAGVSVVCVVDPVSSTVTIYDADQSPVKLGSDEILTLPAVLPEFEVRVGELFE